MHAKLPHTTTRGARLPPARSVAITRCTPNPLLRGLPALGSRRSLQVRAIASASFEYECLQNKVVVKATTGEQVDLLSLWTVSLRLREERSVIV